MPDNETVEWPGMYLFEPLLWGLATAALFTGLVSLVPDPGIRIEVGFGWVGQLVIIGGGVLFAIIGYLVSLQVGEELAARRRGLTRGEYWERYDELRDKRRLRRAHKQKREAEQTIEDVRENAGEN